MAGELSFSSYRVTNFDKVTQFGFSGVGSGGSTPPSPSGDFLLKTGDTATGSYSFDTNTFVINAANHFVGIGIGSPGYLLDVNGFAEFRNSINVVNGISIGDISSTYVLDIQKNYTNIRFRSKSGTPEAYAIFVNNNGGFIVGSNNYTGDGLLGAPYVPYAGIITTVGEYPIVIGTNSLSRILIDSTGKVGVGTITPNYLFHVQGTGYFNDYLHANTHVGSVSFVSGFAGSGWKLDHTTGDATLTVDNLNVRKKMSVYELVINQIRATNGSVWISDCIKAHVISPDSPPSTGQVYPDTDSRTIPIPFVVDDIVRCQKWTGRGIKYYTAIVTAVSLDWFSYSVIDGSDHPEVGDDIVRIGNASDTDRQGSIYLTASDSGAPYIDVLDGVTDESFSGHTKVRVGKLVGITDSIYGALSGYGLYGQNVYLTGFINASLGGLIGGFTIDPTNGLYSGSGSSRVQMKASTGFWAGATAFADAPSSISNAGACKFLSGIIGGFQITSTEIRSAASGQRLILDASGNSLTFFGADDNDYIEINTDVTSSYFGVFDAGNYECMIRSTKILLQATSGSPKFVANIYPGGGVGELIVKGMIPEGSFDLNSGWLFFDRVSGQVFWTT
jgi:hypothetical protein